ncbi:hypothetical protein CVT25_004941 [Psilocybe cyanescens]|uniref:Pali-domain-containing protein n=1 Tax=Psilocybe cyanescens TaxID=93625 RepID=A0A409XUC7_PSICY|nr:hypothetical protein CVT25_004941 [Psilocybe cyanescens]
MSRAFCIPGIVFLVAALVLSFLVSVSLPFLPALDIVRTNFQGGVQQGAIGTVQTRLGIWSACAYDTHGSRTCLKTGHAYTFEIDRDLQKSKVAIVKASWTRGLAVHPVATAAIFIALLLSFSTHLTATLLASLMSFLAALLTLIAFAIDIALFALVRHAMNGLDIGANTNTAPGFWMTFVTLILLLLAGCTVCFGRRNDRMSGATSSYPMSSTGGGFLSRFRKN